MLVTMDNSARRGRSIKQAKRGITASSSVEGVRQSRRLCMSTCSNSGARSDDSTSVLVDALMKLNMGFWWQLLPSDLTNYDVCVGLCGAFANSDRSMLPLYVDAGILKISTGHLALTNYSVNFAAVEHLVGQVQAKLNKNDNVRVKLSNYWAPGKAGGNNCFYIQIEDLIEGLKNPEVQCKKKAIPSNLESVLAAEAIHNSIIACRLCWESWNWFISIDQ